VGAPGVDDSWAEDAADVRTAGMCAAIEAMAAQEPQPAPDGMVDNLSGTDTEMFALLLEAWSSTDVWADFPFVQCPALVIAGEDEEPGADDHALQAAQVLPHGQAVVLPGLGHLQTFWRTDLTLPPLLSFLGEHAGNG
jgi:pimeloyl-ACP methyl ester carboxylesterase